MIAFTILGVLVYWLAMGLIGYCIGMERDFRRGMNSLTAGIDVSIMEIEVLVRTLNKGSEGASHV